ncbi:MAG: hypothetical protein Q9167_001988 [Letrouitia subvulpina]
MAHGKLRYRPLPLIASPLEQHGHAHGHKAHGHGSEQSSMKKGEEVVTVQEQYDATPAFREREEASSIELFYDLFFVANLTTFTANKPIDDKQTISGYIGFFVLLWFTWLQVVVYDVRFGVDSLLERFCKLLHFGVMVSFAIVGNNFDPSSPKDSYVTMRQLSLIMMVSRIILICQYTSVVYWVKQHRKITTPLLIHISALAIGAALCLGFFFTFTSKSSGKAYIGWYVIAVLEALAVFLSSSQWKVVGFKHTNLHERCGLLTLIILGEGIIVLTKAMSYVTKGENFSAAIIGQIISATLIIVSLTFFLCLTWRTES